MKTKGQILIKKQSKMFNNPTCEPHPKSVRLKFYEEDNKKCSEYSCGRKVIRDNCDIGNRCKVSDDEIKDSVTNSIKYCKMQSKLRILWRYKFSMIIYLLLSHWTTSVVGVNSILNFSDKMKYTQVRHINKGDVDNTRPQDYNQQQDQQQADTLYYNSEYENKNKQYDEYNNVNSFYKDAHHVKNNLDDAGREDNSEKNNLHLNADSADGVLIFNDAPNKFGEVHEITSDNIEDYIDLTRNVDPNNFETFNRNTRDTNHMMSSEITSRVKRTFHYVDSPFRVKNITVNLRPKDMFRFSDKVVKLAVILPRDPSHEFSLLKVLPMIELASKAVTDQKKGFLPGWDIRVDYRDSNCSSVYGPLAAFEFYINGTADAFIGPGCEYVIAPVSRYAGAWKIPVMTAGALADAFKHKVDYPTLTRMMGSYRMVGVAMKHILKGFGWERCALIFHNFGPGTTKGNSLCFMTASAIHYMLDGIANKLPSKSFDEGVSTKTDYMDILRNMSKSARIMVVCANPMTVREIMLAAEELNMVSSGEYVFFNIELFSSMSSQSSLEPWKVEGDTPERNERAKKAYTAMLTVTTRTPDDEEYLNFSDKVKQLAQSKYNYTFGNESVSTFVTAFYDAVLLYALALNETLRDNMGKPNISVDGSEIIKKMWNRTFKGITGDVTIDENGDRIASYSLLDMHPDTGKFEVVANYIAANRSLEYVPDRPIYWAGGRKDPPLDTPVCGFDGSLCPDKSLPGYAILSIVLSVVVVVVAALSAILYRRYKLDAEIAMMTWRISWCDVIPAPQGARNRGSVYSLVRRGSQTTMYSDDNLSLPGERQVFVPWGFYKGCKVAIKKVDRARIDLNRPLLLELKKMKDLQHDHLVRFYGACVDPPQCCILTEYCPKGSLQDILENESITLDWMFKVSLMHDVARGISFIHSTDIKSHGSLKSSNCVVDSRFVLKLTDFGLHSLRTSPAEEAEDKESHAYWRKFLWTSPELLRMESPPPEGTQKGDVYSFGIVVQEIVSRNGVFWLGKDLHLSPREIVEAVKMGSIPSQAGIKSDILRPKIEAADCENDRVAELMRKCWSEDPQDRPDFGALKSLIRKLNKEHETGNILDNLLSRMAQYAEDLETQVQERTADYLEEKKKCEELLYQLLPKSVAAQLIRGQSVVAETYDQVTIYFSDIVGFTSLSAQSTPLQVVDLLNDLYTCFDSIIENFDVYKNHLKGAEITSVFCTRMSLGLGTRAQKLLESYHKVDISESKVETIGDAYMVVSGLPMRNGNRHAREVARMSLALLNNVYKFVIRHRPDDQLKLRIGLHSGPCVAGVVGLKMPRYCLFGDTVNTASRMESNGEALRIHVSPCTKAILDTFGCFDLELRGQIPVKGKGNMTTYWLNGEKPDPNALEFHESKMPPKQHSLNIENGNQLSLTPFKQRREISRPNSRRGSASFLQTSHKSKDKSTECQPLLQDYSCNLNCTNGLPSKETNGSNLSLANNVKILNNSNQTLTSLGNSQSFKLKENKQTVVAGGNPPQLSAANNRNNNKSEMNNWLTKLSTGDDIELGKKAVQKTIDYSTSLPLLANHSRDTPADNVV